MGNRSLRVAAMLATAMVLAAARAGAAPPCADARSHQFDFWIGEWEVRLIASDKLVGTNSIRPILDGCVLQESWQGTSGSAGSSLNFYDTRAKRWRQFWVWREGTTLELAGEFRDGRMVMEGDGPEPDGSIARNRISWFANADGTVRQLWEISRDGGATWKAEFDGLYRKRAE